MAGAGDLERDPRLERLLLLVDGVFAIALTLLAVDLRLPEAAAHLGGWDLFHTLVEMWPKLLGYVTSFTAVALYWASHHQTLRFVRRYDGRLMWLALLQLAFIAFLPFPTSVLGEHVWDPVAQEFYFGTLLLTSVVAAIIWWYATDRCRLVDPGLDARIIRRYRRLSLSGPASFILLMALIPAGVGRIINPLLLGYLIAFAYIALSLFDWWEPHAARPAPPAEPTMAPTGDE